MKKLFTIFLVSVFPYSSSLFAQVNDQTETSGAQTRSQTLMPNEFYAGYGALDLFYFTGRMNHTSGFPDESYSYNGIWYSNNFTVPSSVGTVFFGYSRTLNRVISTGMMFGYQSFTYTGTATSNTSGSNTTYDVKVTDI